MHEKFFLGDESDSADENAQKGKFYLVFQTNISNY